MAGLSDIEWTDATWNPITGCSMVSPGCTNCYAMRMAARLQAMGHPAYSGVTRKSGGRHVWTGRFHLVDEALSIPLRWRKPRKIFVNSMSDLFQDDVPGEFIKKIWSVMASANHHIFQVLTKRPDLMLKTMELHRLATPQNVWIGTSVENRDYINRIEILRRIQASVRFVSFEPLIGPVGDANLQGIHWAIVGGESGPDARPLKKEWVGQIKRQCRIFDTAFFFKQWGGTNKKIAGRKYLGRTWNEFPASFG